LDRRLGGSQSRSGHGEEKNSQTLPGLEPPIIEPVVQHYNAELMFLVVKQECNLKLLLDLIIQVTNLYRPC
jgi:hypothetical protein